MTTTALEELVFCGNPTLDIPRNRDCHIAALPADACASWRSVTTDPATGLPVRQHWLCPTCITALKETNQ
ncbi:hypothetical protein [Tessaracoccus massiliensis]|uniref:hypothetical protein n=1 Tax=Tessaracoccus massiliensis TaxID=1522311 RepID=UPI0005903F97|nr:hypothetical protein [Tessaracoccus massiliensis]